MSDTNLILSIITFYVVIIVMATLLGITTLSEQDTVSFPDTTNLQNAMQSFNTGGLFAIVGVFAIFGEALILAFQFMVFIVQLVAFTFTGILPWYVNTILFLPLVLTILYIVTKILRGN